MRKSTKVNIPLQNMSHLPIKYGFIMLPKEFSVITNKDITLNKEKINFQASPENDSNN